jgi:2-desacetyl-2-hydroxyethyl bacteriochlorophyllide A dehydrogenase
VTIRTTYRTNTQKGIPMAKRIVFTGKNEVLCETFEPEASGEYCMHVGVEFSLMSTGTENIVLNRLFSPQTSWDNWVKYPFYPGYCCVGKITGDGNDGHLSGRRVILRYPHASEHYCNSTTPIEVPEGVPAETAVWFALAKIAAQGVRAARYRFGDSVCIIGAGPVGQMSVRWAFACGVRKIVVCDLAQKRLDIAMKGGATAAYCLPANKMHGVLIEHCDGSLPGIVIDTTGNAAVFSDALRLCADFGTIVLLGDTGHPQQQYLSGDVLNRGLTIRGAHDSHTDAIWTEKVIAGLWFDMVKTGRFRIDGLNTHVFKGADCRKSYDLANTDRNGTMGILFDWH